MATRKVWYGLSVVLMLASFASFATRGLNLGIDFTGGVSVEASFPNSANVDAIRARLEGAGFVDPQVQNFGSSRDIAIRLPPSPAQNGAAIRAQLDQILKSIDPGAQILRLAKAVRGQLGAHRIHVGGVREAHLGADTTGEVNREVETAGEE